MKWRISAKRRKIKFACYLRHVSGRDLIDGIGIEIFPVRRSGYATIRTDGIRVSRVFLSFSRENSTQNVTRTRTNAWPFFVSQPVS